MEEQSSIVALLSISVEEALTEEQVNVAGRLASFLSRWKEIMTDPVVLQAITGYKLLFSHHQDSEPTHVSERAGDL